MKVVHSVLKTWHTQKIPWLRGHIRQLYKNGVDNVIVCEVTDQEREVPEWRTYALQERSWLERWHRKLSKRLRLQTPLPLLKNVIREEQPDVLHSHFRKMGEENYKLAINEEIPHVVSFYGYDVLDVKPHLEKQLRKARKMLAKVDAVFCEGPHMKKLIAAIGCSPNKIHIVRLGVDLEKIGFRPRSVNKDDHIKFLIIAAYREKKGIPYALEALGKLQNEFDNFSIAIIGELVNPQGNEEMQKIDKVIQQYELDKRIQWLGYLPHDKMIEEAYNHDIFISPSVHAKSGDKEGGAPLAIIEMAASGMPVVSTTHCDIPNVLGEKNKKLLVDERDSVALKKTILKIINHEVDLLKLEKSNRKLIEQKLDIKKCGSKWVKMYKKVLEEI